jgi:CheY-like chemotaxis protein
MMLTADARPGDIARRTEAALSGYAVRPVSRTRLLSLVCDAMGKREASDPNPTGSIDEKKEPVMPARILIAEDSPDNSMLVELYLKDSPYQLTFEADGKAAVDRFAATDFDLILMDVQMPVMDGLAATLAIRRLEKERGALPIPIIAVTAHGSSQDMERSADAGCNAHLSKPMSKLELLESIERHRRHEQPSEMANAGSCEPVMIEILPGFEQLAPSYLSRRRKEIPEMLRLLAASDLMRLATLGHDMKGSGRGYGFPDLTRFGAALEESAKHGNLETLRAQMTELGEYLDRVQLVAKTHSEVD